MAKRKRLTPANPFYQPQAPDPGSAPSALPRAPIADVAAQASSQAALQEVTDVLAQARSEGRMVMSLALSDIDLGYIVRDRVASDADEMATLKASLMARGQQVPIDVVALEGGQYGLISGWRRCQAIAELYRETGDTRFAEVRALPRKPAELSDSYLAMVEENEIRANLSYFERARIVSKAVEQGVFENHKSALQALFSSASRAKRSKIRSFLTVVEALDGTLRFPQSIGERLGLALSKGLEERPRLAAALRQQIAQARPATAEAEQEVLKQALTPYKRSPDAPSTPWADRDIRPGLTLRRHQGDGRIELRGPALTDDLHDRLVRWLRDQR